MSRCGCGASARRLHDVLAAALFVILSGRYGDAEAKWAFGVVGTILGYWLKK